VTEAIVPLAPQTWFEYSHEAVHGAATIHKTSEMTHLYDDHLQGEKHVKDKLCFYLRDTHKKSSFV
jgi:hypothetical protein